MRPEETRTGRTPAGSGALVVAAALAAATAAACGGGSRALPADAAPQTVAAVDACKGMSGQERQDCYEERLLDRLHRDGTRAALDMLSEIAAADRSVEREAHVYTHAIGIESYDPARPVGEEFAECTELFQSGCYHGVIQAYFMAQGTVDQSTVRALCESFKQPGADRFLLFQCLHGMGHGLVMIYGHHLPRALEDCDLLETHWDRESCYGGAFMENVVAATNPHHAATELAAEHEADGEAMAVGDIGGENAEGGEHAGHAAADAGGGHEHAAMTFAGDDLEPFEPLREDDPQYPCSVLDRRYLTACYMMQTSVMLWFNGNSIGRAADSCADAPEDFRRTCFQSLGRDVSARTLQDPDESLKECRKSPEEYRGWCYTGLVKNFVDLTATFDRGFAFCALIEERYQPRCYEAMGEEIGILRATGAEKREECSVVEADEMERSCLRGARVLGE